MLDSPLPDDRRVIALLGLVQISEEGMGWGPEDQERQDELDAATNPLLAEIARLTEELNEEARLNGMGGEREADLRGKIERLEHTCEAVALHRDKAEAEIERLTDLVAMQSEALTSVRAYLIPRVANSGTTGRTIIMPEVENAISATAETVSAWQSKRDKELLESIASWFPQDGSDEYMRLRDIEAKIAELRAKGE